MRSRTANWFLCKIRYEKVMEDGLQKKVTEQYVVDALNFSEAETRITQEMSSYISGEFEVVEIDRCPCRGCAGPRATRKRTFLQSNRKERTQIVLTHLN